MLRLWKSLFLTAAASALLATAAQARPQIRIEPQRPLAGEPFILSIVGEQTDSCVPEFVAMEFENWQIIIRGTRSTSGCAKSLTQYEINLDPAAAQPDGVLDSGVYEIKFYVSEDSEPLARLQAFKLLQIGEQKSNIRPEPGLWWAQSGGLYATSGPGAGFSIEVQDDRLVMMSNAYDFAGGPSWFFSSGNITGHLVDASLLSLHGGQSLFGDYSAPETVLDSGRVLINFHNQATATAYFLTPRTDAEHSDLLLHPISLVRYAFARGNQAEILSGQWLVVIEDDPQNSSSTRYDFKVPADRYAGDLALSDALTGAVLDCDGDASRPSSPPDSCQLSNDGSGVEILFDQIGLDRLYGWTELGQRATAIRWQR